jgi:four helix bundle protein
MHTYPFEKLIVWQRSRELNKQIYTITSKFPSEEKFGIVSQIRRAGVSVSNNLAEGSARISSKEQARFSEIAYSSLMEVLNLYILAHDLNFLNTKDLEEIRPLIEEISWKINSLRISQLEKHKKQNGEES